MVTVPGRSRAAASGVERADVQQDVEGLDGQLGDRPSLRPPRRRRPRTLPRCRRRSRPATSRPEGRQLLHRLGCGRDAAFPGSLLSSDTDLHGPLLSIRFSVVTCLTVWREVGARRRRSRSAAQCADPRRVDSDDRTACPAAPRRWAGPPGSTAGPAPRRGSGGRASAVRRGPAAGRGSPSSEFGEPDPHRRALVERPAVGGSRCPVRRPSRTLTPSSSRSSRCRASSAVSPGSTFPPGNSHIPANCGGAVRRATRSLPGSARESTTAPPTTPMSPVTPPSLRRAPGPAPRGPDGQWPPS